jgi:mRNA interferase MazF
MKTGEIWLAQLDPTLGSEIQKTRPCVVISPEEMNSHLRTVIVAPMTTGSRPAHFRIALTFQGKQGLIVLDQIRTLDRIRSAWARCAHRRWRRRLGRCRPCLRPETGVAAGSSRIKKCRLCGWVSGAAPIGQCRHTVARLHLPPF